MKTTTKNIEIQFPYLVSVSLENPLIHKELRLSVSWLSMSDPSKKKKKKKSNLNMF